MGIFEKTPEEQMKAWWKSLTIEQARDFLEKQCTCPEDWEKKKWLLKNDMNLGYKSKLLWPERKLPTDEIVRAFKEMPEYFKEYDSWDTLRTDQCIALFRAGIGRLEIVDSIKWKPKSFPTEMAEWLCEQGEYKRLMKMELSEENEVVFLNAALRDPDAKKAFLAYVLAYGIRDATLDVVYTAKFAPIQKDVSKVLSDLMDVHFVEKTAKESLSNRQKFIDYVQAFGLCPSAQCKLSAAQYEWFHQMRKELCEEAIYALVKSHFSECLENLVVWEYETILGSKALLEDCREKNKAFIGQCLEDPDCLNEDQIAQLFRTDGWSAGEQLLIDTLKFYAMLSNQRLIEKTPRLMSIISRRLDLTNWWLKVCHED